MHSPSSGKEENQPTEFQNNKTVIIKKLGVQTLKNLLYKYNFRDACDTPKSKHNKAPTSTGISCMFKRKPMLKSFDGFQAPKIVFATRGVLPAVSGLVQWMLDPSPETIVKSQSQKSQVKRPYSLL